MKIESCRVRKLNIPFKVSFRHSLAARSEVESVIFEVKLTSGETGYGECIPRDYVTGETVVSVIERLSGHIIPALEGRTFASFSELKSWILDFPKHFPALGEKELCVRCTAELALLDAFGKHEQKSLLQLINQKYTDKITYSAVISAEKPEAVAEIVKQFAQLGMNMVKLKVGEDLPTDLSNISVIREILGDQASIRIDANAAWDLDTAKDHLRRYTDLGIVSVEQPMPVNLRNDYPKLVSFIGTSMLVGIDENLCSYQDALWFAENAGASMFNIRVSKNGGILESLRIVALAKEHGIKCQLGAQVGETSILSAAGRHVAAIAQDFVFHEGSFGTHLLAYDLTQSPVHFSAQGLGSIDEISSPGLGVEVDLPLLEKMTVK